MRFLFLDIDGVLNSRAWYMARPSKDDFAKEHGISPEVYDHDRLTWAQRSIDPAAVAALNDIVRLAGCRVVVSSTWRTMYPLPKLERILRERGFEHHLIGATPEGWTVRERGHRSVERGEEIAAWMKTIAPPGGVREDNIVIVDDDSDMAHLKSRLFQTHHDVGLLAEHVDAVVKMYGP